MLDNIYNITIFGIFTLIGVIIIGINCLIEADIFMGLILSVGGLICLWQMCLVMKEINS